MTLTTTILLFAPRRGKNEGGIRGIVSRRKTSFFCWDFSVFSGKSAAGDRGQHRGPIHIRGEGDVDLNSVDWVFAIRDRTCLFSLVGYPEEMFGDAGKELLETTIERGGRVKETFERDQGGGAMHVLPRIRVMTGGVVNTHPTDSGGESPYVDRIELNTNLNHEAMLMPNRSPPLTGENRDLFRQKKGGNLITVLKEGKPLDKDKVTPLPKRRGPNGPSSGDL
jgi:hypothetical protein